MAGTSINCLAIVLKELRSKVVDLSRMRALGFCVSVAHAEYMTRIFNAAGIPPDAVMLILDAGIAFSTPASAYSSLARRSLWSLERRSPCGNPGARMADSA